MENELDINSLLNSECFDTSYLLTKFNEGDVEFNLENFKNFIDNYIKKATKFEDKTGIPKKHFIEKINLSLFSRKCYQGYTNVKNVYIYFDDNNDAIFLKNKKEIAKVKKKNIKGEYWLIDKLEKINIEHKPIVKDSNIDNALFLTNKFYIKKSSNFFIRYYINSLYDIVVKHDNKYHMFFDLNNIDEYSFTSSNLLTNNDLLKIKRMLKIGKIGLKKI